MFAKKVLEKFGERAAEAIIMEFKKLNDKEVFVPMYYNQLMLEQRRKALQAITLMSEKRCGKIKGKIVANGSVQREYVKKEGRASPIVSLEALLLTCVIDATEGRDVATADISEAFLQADMN